MSDKSDPKSQKPEPDVKTDDQKKPKDLSSSSTVQKRLAKTSETSGPTDISLTTQQPVPSDNISVQTANTTGSDTDLSVLTMEPLKYLEILDEYVTGRHWNFDIEYNLNAASGIFWSLIIPFIVLNHITDVCWDLLSKPLYSSVIVASITALELILVSIVWYSSQIFKFINRINLCVAVLYIHLVLGTMNLCLAIIEFGTNSCYQLGKVDPLEPNVVIKYEMKVLAILHSFVAINLFICGMLLAIKRNDFKYFVLWRKGLLDEYIQFEGDQD